MLDNDISNPAPIPRATGDFVDAAREFSTAYCHGVNTDNAKHQREHDFAMRRLEIDAVASREAATTERRLKWAGITLLGTALMYSIWTNNVPLISHIVSLFVGIVIGSSTASRYSPKRADA